MLWLRTAAGLTLALILGANASAQTYDPTANYANPEGGITTDSQRNNPCPDPWVSIALKRVYGDNPDRSQCTTTLYNQGQWNDYNQLVHAVAGVAMRRALPSSQKLGAAKLPDGKPVVTLIEGSRIVAAGGGNLSGQGAAHIVAAGGGNIVPTGGGKIVAAGGGNIVAAGGGNLTKAAYDMLAKMEYRSKAPDRTLQGMTVRRVPGSRSALVIK
jgi:hypothetical protein